MDKDTKAPAARLAVTALLRCGPIPIVLACGILAPGPFSWSVLVLCFFAGAGSDRWGAKLADLYRSRRCQRCGEEYDGPFRCKCGEMLVGPVGEHHTAEGCCRG